MGQAIEKVPILWSQRLLLAFMVFLGSCFVYVARVNLSVAILCMVRSDDDVSNHTMPVSNRTTIGLRKNSTQRFIGDTSLEKGNLTFIEDSRYINERHPPPPEGEFDWDKSTRSRLLSMYFYGYIVTQIPGGWLASRYGGGRVWGICMFVSALSSLLTPVGARVNINIAYVIRFILGFSAGVTFPCTQQIWGKWAPPFERSKLAAIGFAGPLIGLISTFSISGLLCEYGFDNGWGSIFYLSGLFGLVWTILWFYLTSDSPDNHRNISQQERTYIRKSIGAGLSDKKLSTPWMKILTSKPVWAMVIAHSANNYTNYTLLTSLPTFMKESLHFDIKENGVLSSLPYITQFISSLVCGNIADIINERGWLKVRNQRKTFQAISLLGAGLCLCLTAQVDRSHRYVAVVLLCLCTAFLGFNRGSYMVNHLDLAPSFAGILFGITNTAATIPGMIAPVIAGALTPNKTAEEWANVFYVCAAVGGVGVLLYCAMADGELQEWGRVGDEGSPEDQERHAKLMYEINVPDPLDNQDNNYHKR